MKLFGMFLALALSLVTAQNAHATASSVVQSSYKKSLDHDGPVRVVHLLVTASSVDGSVADVTVPALHGYLMKAITKPGTSPTDNYDIELYGPDVAIDALNGAALNRATATTQVIYPVGALGAAPLFLEPGDYTLHITNNSVHSATVDIWLYMVDAQPSRRP